MKNKFNLINSLKEEIDNIKFEKVWDQEFYEKIKIDFTYQNNKIENNSLTYGQTIQFLKNAVTPANIGIKDFLDIQNHYDILDTIFKIYREELSESLIIDLHKVLMKDLSQWKNSELYSPGLYKWDTNYTLKEDGSIHWFMSYKIVPEAMKELIESTNFRIKNSDILNLEFHPLTTATFFHNCFVGEIHPFADGNGRVSRIIMNDILIKKGFTPIFIKDIDKLKYFKLFGKSPSKEIEPMVDFFADQLIESLNLKRDFILNSEKKKNTDIGLGM